LQPALLGAITLVLADRPADAITLLDCLDPFMRRRFVVAENCVRAQAHRCAGELEAALRCARTGFDHLNGENHQAHGSVCTALLAAVLLELGHLDEAEAVLNSCSSPGMRRAWGWSMVLETRGRLCAARGVHKGALALFVAAGRHAANWPFRNPAMLSWRSRAALAQAELGRHDAARPLVEEELGLARRWGSPRSLGTALRAAAAVAGSDGGGPGAAGGSRPRAGRIPCQGGPRGGVDRPGCPLLGTAGHRTPRVSTCGRRWTWRTPARRRRWWNGPTPNWWPRVHDRGDHGRRDRRR
jgi:hypothetical protein